mgnify:CR=1 FL=1
MDALNNGFQEVVGIVADLDASARNLCTALGFEVRHSGAVPDGALALWGLSGRMARETLIGHPDSQRGHIRLIQLDGAPAPRMRDGGQAWDTGGIFDINIRALQNIEPLHQAMGLSGFLSPAPIVDWDFGPLSVREVVENNADGLAIALMQRVAPPLAGYEAIGGNASWVFNSTQVVPDFDAARALYCDALGWKPVQESVQVHEDGKNCMGLPLGLAPGVTARIGIYQSQGQMQGSTEIIAFDCGGHDFSAADVPGRGWAALCFPVSDVAGFARKARQAGCAVSNPVEFEWDPHGRVRGISARTRWGARLDALESLSD